jgi:hypothetical protein
MTALLATADTLPDTADPPAITRLMLRALVYAEMASWHTDGNGGKMGLELTGTGWRAAFPGADHLESSFHPSTVHALCHRGLLAMSRSADRAVITPLGERKVAEYARLEPGEIRDE